MASIGAIISKLQDNFEKIDLDEVDNEIVDNPKIIPENFSENNLNFLLSQIKDPEMRNHLQDQAKQLKKQKN